MTLETKRTQLRSVVAADKDDVLSLYQDVSVRKYLGGIVDSEIFSKRFSALLENNESYDFTVRKRDSGAFIGLINLSPHCEHSSHEVSYQLLPPFWNQGLGSELLEKVFEYAFETLGLNTLCAETQVANIASVCLLEKMGMRLESELERYGERQAIYQISADFFSER